eukprot:scaffold11809_cov128-Cylindrotheca_fusiformis.AAC.11
MPTFVTRTFKFLSTTSHKGGQEPRTSIKSFPTETALGKFGGQLDRTVPASISLNSGSNMEFALYLCGSLTRVH